MSVNLRVWMLRMQAHSYRARAAQLDLAATMLTVGAAVQNLVQVVQRSDATDLIAAHPDLAYVDLQMDAFYGEATTTPEETS
ncbi:hypothetical protein [Streptosporangium sp. G12]